MAPFTAQRASLKKHYGADSGAVFGGKPLYAADQFFTIHDVAPF